MKQHANYSVRVMETGNHFKNGASLKSQMSRRNIILKMAILFVFVMTSLISNSQNAYSPSCDSNVDFMTIKSIETNSYGTDVTFRMYSTKTATYQINKSIIIYATNADNDIIGTRRALRFFDSCGNELSFGQVYGLDAYKSNYCDLIIRFEKSPYNAKYITIVEEEKLAGNKFYWANIALNNSASSASNSSSSSSSFSAGEAAVAIGALAAIGYGIYKIFGGGDDDSSSSSSSSSGQKSIGTYEPGKICNEGHLNEVNATECSHSGCHLKLGNSVNGVYCTKCHRVYKKSKDVKCDCGTTIPWSSWK